MSRSSIEMRAGRLRAAAGGLAALVLISFVPGCASDRRADDCGASAESGPLTIAAIQGACHVSPRVGETVSGVVGVVTAVSSRDPRHGFWIESPTPDADPRTSEGLFVEVGERGPKPALGDLVEVSGTVVEAGFSAEELTVTTLRGDWVRVAGEFAPLPPPQRLGAGGRPIPAADFGTADGVNEVEAEALDYFESLEGMRVRIDDAWVTGATRSFGEIVVLADAGVGVELRSRRGGAVVSDGDFNPERLVLDPGRVGIEAPQVNVGDAFDGAIVGVVDYSFSNYKVVPTQDLPRVVKSSVRRDSTELQDSAAVLSIATYNVLNLGGDDPDSTFDRLARTIVKDLASPAIVALQEVQDDDGPADTGRVGADRTLAKLCDAIVAARGPRYEWFQISPVDGLDGGQPGGNIRVAYLVDPERVSARRRGRAGAGDETVVLPGPEFSASPGRIGTASEAFEGVRKSLALEVEFADRVLFLINNHWISKRGDDRLQGARQPPIQGTEEKRLGAAKWIAGLVRSLLDEDAEARVVVLGDLNEHEFRAPVQALVDAGLVNLVEEGIEATDRYSYVFEGNAQILDNVLVSPALARSDPQIDIVHVNAEFPDRFQASDHDPILVLLPLD